MDIIHKDIGHLGIICMHCRGKTATVRARIEFKMERDNGRIFLCLCGACGNLADRELLQDKVLDLTEEDGNATS